MIEGLEVFPFAGQVQRQWRWQPGLPSQPKPEQIELPFSTSRATVVPTNDGKTYFTLPTQGRLRRVAGVYSPLGGSAPTLEAYVRKVESSGGAIVLRDTTAKVTDFDAFGNVLAEEVVDQRRRSHAPRRAHVQERHRAVGARAAPDAEGVQRGGDALAVPDAHARRRRSYGEVETESTESDDGSPETKLKVVYERDDFGNVTEHHGGRCIRASPVVHDDVRRRGHLSREPRERGRAHDVHGVRRRGSACSRSMTDPNQLVTERQFDGFGRLGLETRPDGTQTTITLSRTKDGGPSKKAWRVTQRTTTSGGADDTVEYDSLGRPIRWWWHGPATPRPTGDPPRLMQEVAYDARSGKVARRSVPVSEGTPESEILFDVYEYDALGREVRHTTPWNAAVQTAYDGLLVEVTDPLLNVTIIEHDALGRPVTITDAAKGRASWSTYDFERSIRPGGPSSWKHTLRPLKSPFLSHARSSRRS